MSNVTQRDVFFNELYKLAKQDPDIVLVVADMSAPALDIFRKEMPNQFINVGIAEQNAIVIASGLAISGKKVFVYAIAPFITLRCLEQIRVSNAIMNIPITIIGMGTGFSYDSDGPTHHLIEDIAILRAFPNIKINTITDNVMAAKYPKICYEMNAVNYVRLDKNKYTDIYDSSFDFPVGISKIRGGKENLIISMCPMVNVVNEIVDYFSFDIGLIDIFKIPINEEIFLKMIKEAKKIITIEEHFLPGGLGSAICEVLNDNNINIHVKRLGLNINFGYKYSYKYGGREIIRSHHGIDVESLKKIINEYFE